MPLRLVFCFLLLYVSLPSCKKVNAAKGDKQPHLVQVPYYNKIDLRAGGILIYNEDTTVQLTSVLTTSEVMEALNIYVEDSTLIIDVRNGYSIKNADKIQYSINGALIKEFVLSGTGEIYVNRTTDSILDRCDLILNGSGEINVNQMNCAILLSVLSGNGEINVQGLETQSNNSVISGSGDIALYGNTIHSYLQINGTGNIYSYPLQADHTVCNASGSASMRVQADSTLDVSISGYANIFYKGYPTITTDITGDGGVFDDN